ncbi:CRISPR-associated protein Cas4 [Oceanidesulfovibrio indonesiensis]|jgi:CRISPR-associated exonuclease Cas4|uniref:CRISPR-associated exonuclease Cas4 n=1 Tax=Oceanidesulfovibrio indonesiensis TaxID=54767 RepID=A0A7M3MA79_9BACT|nr:CRISPR-associated protein Cas4 [Oceanidesulfovibrio indonesiensis]TVM14506.1 CRISPR-associated protein Cas4 [Oceanidesulfovibrio indonesiensis]
MYDDADLLPISALQHLAFCERQCGLIHLEQAWNENALTAYGRILHKRADRHGRETRRGVRTEFAVPIASRRLGLFGKADAVEFPASGPCPVEYKRGKAKAHDADRVQLAAQAMCLEEMTGATIPEAALWYGATRQREPVTIDDALRSRVEDLAAQLHAMMNQGATPPPRKGPHCKACSMRGLCLPDIFRGDGSQGTKSAVRYLGQMRRDRDHESENAP